MQEKEAGQNNATAQDQSNIIESRALHEAKADSILKTLYVPLSH